MDDRKNIEAIYPLAPMQEAMLLQSIQARGADPGFLQMTTTLHGHLDEDRLRRAWEQVVHNHFALRTSLHWESLEKPLQIVHRAVALPWRSLDWRTMPDAGAARDALLEADRSEGLVLTKPPLQRITIARIAPDESFLLWSCHHALLDGWSGALVLDEVLDVYGKISGNERAAAAPSQDYRDYVLWLQRQNLSQAEAYWRRSLDGFTQPTPLPRATDVLPGTSDSGHVQTRLSAETTDALEGVIRALRVTWNTLLQGIWAITLSRFAGKEDVVFGTTDSGRTVDFPGIESMVGLFINTIPVRVRVEQETDLADFLRQIQREQLASRPHAFATPAQVQSWSPVSFRDRLYETLLVVQNYPRPRQAETADGALTMSEVRSGITSAFPLTLVAMPGSELAVHMLFDEKRFAAGTASSLLGFVRALLDHVAADPECTVAALGARVAEGPVAVTGITASEGSRPRRSLSAPYVAPADVLETQLSEIWARTLGVQSVGLDDDFFDLGGHSLLVVHLVDQIERTLGRRVPPATLIRTTSVRQLARLLRDEGWTPPWSSLVPMQPEGNRPPLFCIHSWNGDILHFRHLARLMAPDYPVFGMQAAGLGSDAPLHATVEEMAAHYVSEIRSVFPRGPYALAGLCFGMKVAVEMARQLVDQGDEVASLFVLDTGVTLADPSARSRLGYYLHRGREGVREMGAAGFARSVVSRRIGTVKKKLNTPPASDPQARFAPFVEATRSAWRQYALRPYAGPITFVRSSGWAGERKRAWQLAAWERIAAGGLTTVVVPGRHAGILKPPHVEVLAEHIKHILNAHADSRSDLPASTSQVKPAEQVA